MTRRDLVAGTLVTVMWGCNFSVIEVGLGSLDPFVLTFLRFTCCAIPAIFLIPRPRDVPVKYLAFYGVLFGAGMWWVVNFAMFNGLSAGLASVFLQFSAFFTAFLGWLVFKEALNSVHIAGMLLSCAGLIGISSLAHESQSRFGLMLVLLAAMSWAVCNMIVKFSKPKDMVAFIVWSSAFSAPAIFIMTIVVEGLRPFEQTPGSITWAGAFSVLFQAYITTIVGYMVWNNLMKRYPSAEVAPLSLLVPISGILSSHLFFGEALGAAKLAAVALVITGIGLFINATKIRAILLRRAA